MIQIYKPQHLDEIMNIWLNTNISAHSFIDKTHWENAAETVKSLLPKSALFVYESENTVKGFIGITNHIYIAGLFVSECCQSRGIGQKLLDYSKQRHAHLELDVFVKNERAVHFYEKNQFLPVQRKMNPDFKREEYHMVWPAQVP